MPRQILPRIKQEETAVKPAKPLATPAATPQVEPNPAPLASLSQRLADSRLPVAQRQTLAAQIGQLGGNRYLQRLMTTLKPSPPLTPTIQREGGLVEQPAPGEGGRDYSGLQSKPFTPQEQVWIDEVLANPIIELIFDSYPAMPPVIIHRVQKLSAAGQYSPAINELAIDDAAYGRPADEIFDQDTVTAEDEEAFKGTLLHEIFHYLENNAKAVAKEIPIPKNLIAAMLYPTQVGLDPYAFGWFIHPDNKSILHFQLNGITSPAGDYSIFGHEGLMKVYKKGAWEASPMPQSGHSISIEEDLAESFSMALASERTNTLLKENYPLRYQLLDHYVQRLDSLRQKADKR